MSGYPPIPRDPSGAPLPVVWDDGLQSWKVYEGLMPLETKLAAIESKLLALDSKFADGSAKVALSGTNLILLEGDITLSGESGWVSLPVIDVSSINAVRIAFGLKATGSSVAELQNLEVRISTSRTETFVPNPSGPSYHYQQPLDMETIGKGVADHQIWGLISEQVPMVGNNLRVQVRNTDPTRGMTLSYSIRRVPNDF